MRTRQKAKKTRQNLKVAAALILLLGGTAFPRCASGQTLPGPNLTSALTFTPALTIADAVSAALATNPAAQTAAQQLAQAEARLGQAQAQRRFSVTFDSTVSGSSASVIQPPPAQEIFGTLQNTLTVPLHLGRRSGFAVQQASEQLAAARSAFQSARLALAGQAATAYYDLLRKQALQSVAQTTLAQAQRELSIAQKRNRAGDVAQLDVLQAQVPVANAEAALGKAGNDVEIARQTLNDLVGRPLDAPLSIADVTGPPPPFPYSLAQVREIVLERSADVRAADATLRADTAALAGARLYNEPSVSIQAIDIRSNDQTSFSRLDTLQAAVTIPLSDGGLGRQQVREAEAALAQGRAQALSARKAALIGISAAFLTARSARDQRTAVLAARDIAQITYDKTVLGYRKGLFPLINVLNAQTALTQARIAYIQALYDAASAGSILEAALSGGIPGGSVPTAPGTPPAVPANLPPLGTSPAGAGNPGTSPSGTSTTGPGADGPNGGGKGGP